MATERLFINATAFRAGPFNSANRYLRNGTSGSDFPLVRGFTLTITTVFPSTYPVAAIRYSVAGYVQATTDPAGAGSFNADYDLVTT